MQRRQRIVAPAFVATLVMALLGLPASAGRGEEPPTAVDPKAFDRLLSEISQSSKRILSHEAPASWATHVITGRLSDSEGLPLAGAKLVLFHPDRYDDLHASNLAIADAEGRFRLRGSPRMSRLLFATTAETWELEVPADQTELMLRLPPRQAVQIELARDIDLVGSRLDVIAADRADFPADRTVTRPRLRSPGRVQLDRDRRAQVLLPPGQYTIQAAKRLQDGKITHSEHVTLADFEVPATGNEPQDVRIGEPAGTRIVGHVAGLPDAVDVGDAEIVVARIEVGIDAGGEFEYRTYDAVLVDEEGNFSAGPVPAGPCLIRVEPIDRPDVRPKGDRLSFPLKRWIELAGPTVEIELGGEALTTALAVQQILASEMSRRQINVSWFLQDVRIANLTRLPDRAGAESELIRILRDRRFPAAWRSIAADALGRFGPVSDATRAALVQQLDSKVPRRARQNALRALGQLGADATPSTEAIAAAWHDPDVNIRFAVLLAMQDICRKSKDPPPVAERIFLYALDEPDFEMRKWAIGCCAERKMVEALPRLRALMDDPIGTIRACAAWAVWSIAGDARTVATMLEVLEGDDLEARREAAFYLQFFDARAAAALPTLQAYAQSTLTPPLANADETLAYRLQAASQIAVEKIEAAVATQGELIED